MSVLPKDDSATNRGISKPEWTRMLGERIARERALRALTIEDLAHRSGISTGLMSQLERGIGNPSLGTMLGIARALGLPVGAFFDNDASVDDILVRPRTRKRLVLKDRGLTYEMLVPDLRGSISMLRIELPPHFSNEERPFAHPGEECEFVLDGAVEAHIGTRTLALAAGDSIRFASATLHWFRTGDEGAVVISAMTPPSF